MESKVSVISQEFDDFEWKEDKGTYTLQNNAKVKLLIEDGTEIHKIVTFTFKKGFKCDGLSVPRIFQWFIPKWDWNNMLFNLAGAIHDALYGNKGFKKFTRDDSDAIFRSLLRHSGYNRFHASLADFMLGLFACLHWGDDSYKCKKLVTMTYKKEDK